MTIGGVVFTDLTNLKILVAKVQRAGTDVNTNFADSRLAVATGYQVTSGKTLRIRAIQLFVNTGGTVRWNVGYGDSDAGQDNSTGPTNQKFPGASLGASPGVAPTTSATPVEMAFIRDIPSQKYPFLSVGDGACILKAVIYGYEE